MKCDVRLAELDDLNSIRQCVELAYRPYVPMLGVEPAPLHADYEKLVLEKAVYILRNPLAEMMGILVIFDEENCVLVDNVALFPQWQRRGILLEVFAFVIDRMGRQGQRYMRTFTNEKLKRNIELYQKLGFQIERVEEMIDRTAVHMRLDVEEIEEDVSSFAGKFLRKRRSAR